MSEGADAVHVVPEIFQPPAHPARNLRTAGSGEAGEPAVVGDGHDAGDDGYFDAESAAGVDEGEIGIGIVEVLGDGGIRAGIDLALEVIEVLPRPRRLGVDLRIGRDLDVERRAGLLAHEGYQLVRIGQFPGGYGAHTGRQVAAQGNDAPDIQGPVVAQDLPDLGPAGADAGEVGGGVDAPTAQERHRIEGALAGGAAGAVGHGEVGGGKVVQPLYRVRELVHAHGCLGREELEAVGMSGLCFVIHRNRTAGE